MASEVKRFSRAVSVMAAMLCLAAPLTASEQPKTAADAHDANTEDTQRWALLEQYCSDCHNTTDWAGGIAFDTLTPEGVPEEAAVWEATVRKLRGGLMPPPGKPQPRPEAVKAFVSWMETRLDSAAQARPNPGHVVLHRLNRTEYARSIKEMLDLEVDVKSLLPPDNESGGFDNVADVLSVSPTFLEQYLSAARNISILAVGSSVAKPGRAFYQDAEKGNRSGHVAGLPLGTRGGIGVEHYFPADGEYEINLHVDSRDSNLLRSYWLEYPHTLVVTIDDRKVFEQSLGGAEDQRAVDKELIKAANAIQNRFKGIKVPVKAGKHRVGAAFILRSFAHSDAALEPLAPGEGVDQVPVIRSLEILGPFGEVAPGDTPSRRKIFVCRPTTASEELPCARRILSTIARQAYRRPITEEDLAAPLRFYEQGRAEDSFDAGIQKGLMAILASPKFLYRADLEAGSVQPGQIRALSDLALASRLSFFLWSQGPDETLLSLAERGQLSDPSVLEAQVRRMLADPRSKALTTNWAFKWLHVSALDRVDPDSRLYPNFDEDLREAFRKELSLFIDSILREDRSVLELLSARHTYVNERLARHYGIRSVRGDRFRRVELEDSRRWGLLGKGGILMSTSYPDRTSPVLRGAWLLENIIGTPPAAPPPGVETALAQTEPGGKSLTVRERLEQHRENPSCNQCHGVIDPLGLALENFDAIGEWVEKDRFAGTPIDASGELAGGVGLVKGVDDLRRALLARPDQFAQTLTEKLMTYALGRQLDHQDMPAVRAIVRDAATEDYRFLSIVMGVVNSAPFRMMRAPEHDETSTEIAHVHH